MRVAVTGATGFTGGHTLKALIDAGHEPRALVRSAEKLSSVEALHGLPRIDHVVGDVINADDVARLVDGCEALIHTAAVASLDPSMEQLMRETNVPATRTVLEAAVAQGCDPVVHVSSISALHPPPGDRYTSGDPITAQPVGAYAETKAEAERIARALQDDGAPIVIVWPSGIYGPDDVGLSVAAEGTARLMNAGALPLPSTGGMLFHDVRDLATVLTRCIEPRRGPRRYGVFGQFFTWPEMADFIREVTGADLKTPSLPAGLFRGVGRFGDVLRKVRIPFPLDGVTATIMTATLPGDDEDTRRDLDIEWRPIEQTFADTLRWLIAEGHLDRAKAPALAD